MIDDFLARARIRRRRQWITGRNPGAGAAGAFAGAAGAAAGRAAVRHAGLTAAGMVGRGAGVGASAGPVGATFGALAALALYGGYITYRSMAGPQSPEDVAFDYWLIDEVPPSDDEAVLRAYRDIVEKHARTDPE